MRCVANFMSRLCVVCNTNPHKYRCPKCRIVYCSVRCFKDHACGAVPSSTAAAERPATSHGVGANNAGDNNSSATHATGVGEQLPDDQYVPGALVRPDNVARLQSNARVINYLSDSRLQAVMREIDGSRHREKALAQALETNPAFKQVMDAIVEGGGWIAE